MNSSSKCNHSPDEIVYVCTCNQFLCERCRASHKQLHDSKRENETIKEIQQVRERTDQIISNYLQHLDSHLKSIKDYKQDISSSKQFTEGFEMIAKAQNEVKKLVNAFFKVIETDFDKKCRLVKQDYEQNLQRVENKLLYTIETFQQLFQGLRSLKKTTLWQKTLDVALNFDFNAEITKIDREVESVIEEKFYISMNTKALDSVLEELHNYIQILTDDRKSNIQYTPTDEILLPKNLDISINMNHHRRRESAKRETFLEDLNSSKNSAGRLSAQNFEGFEVTVENYFHEDCPRKILHFFESGSKNLYIIPLQEVEAGAPRCHKIELNIKSDIPFRHRSVITPFGEIYLTGGVRGEEELAYTFKLNVMNGALLPKRLMSNPRKSHGLCYMGDYIYAIGGYNATYGALPFCEKYDIAHDKWIQIAPISFRTSSPSVCTFKNKYIFKFGGLEGSSKVSEQIEKYDVELDRWSNYQVHNHLDDLTKMNFKILWLSASCQLNDHDIIVFGGCDESNLGSKQTFLFEVIEGEGHETACNIVKRNTMPLPYAAGFWNSQCVVQNGKMYSLQNELMDDDPSRAYENSRNLLVFDGVAWQVLKVSFAG